MLVYITPVFTVSQLVVVERDGERELNESRSSRLLSCTLAIEVFCVAFTLGLSF